MRRGWIVAAVGAGLLAAAAPAAAKSPATCGPGDRPEPALQGQVPRSAQGEESRKGFWCGMRLVGHSDIANRGANYGMTWSGECAYVSTPSVGTSEPAGVAVIDARDPRRPEVAKILTTPASIAALETLHAVDAPGRSVLVTGTYDKAPSGELDVYDTRDCARPRLATTWPTPYPVHNVTISRDGRYVYATTPTSEPPHLFVVDISELAAPKVVATLDVNTLVAQGGRPAPLGLHRVDVNPDGTASTPAS